MRDERSDVSGEVEPNDAVVWALFVLLTAFLCAAIVDFEGAASLGVKAGYGLLALAPWVLIIRSQAQASVLEASSARRPTVFWGWMMLEVGAIAQIPGYLRPVQSYLIGASLVMATGAAAMLWRLRPKPGARGTVGHAAWMAVAAVAGLGLALVGLDPRFEPIPVGFGHVLVSSFLLPQVLQDWTLLRWAKRLKADPAGREALSAMGMPFILWSLAGHLIVAPSILYWRSIPEVLWGGFAAALLLVLFAVRASVGSFSKRSAALLITASVAYAVALAYVAKGNRWYWGKDSVVVSSSVQETSVRWS